jgi:L-glutamine-phosphate cytidylyltransferase
MKAIILAAGRGGRLSDVTGPLPKCLMRLGSLTLLERQMTALRDAGVADITVVAGYGSADVRRVCGLRVDMVHNARFAATNSLYSLWLARDLLSDGFVVLNCDVLFHPQLLTDLLTARYEDALLMAARGDTIYSDEEMKVRVRAGRVVDIAKTIDSADADGENVGIAKFGRAGARVLVEEIDRLVAGGAVRAWLPEAFAAFARRRPLHVVETRGFPWIEIDFPEDYWQACAHVLPSLETDASASHRRPVAAASGRTLHHV